MTIGAVKFHQSEAKSSEDGDLQPANKVTFHALPDVAEKKKRHPQKTFPSH